METLIVYALKVSIAIATFYLLHILLFRKETFFRLRRGYFIFALFFSLSFPFFNPATLGIGNNAITTAFNLKEIVVFAQKAEIDNTPTKEAHSNTSLILTSVAIMGSIFLLGKFTFQLFSLFNIIGKAKIVKRKKGLKILETRNPLVSTFSFFRTIVINLNEVQQSSLQDILVHEETHALQFHSFDVLIYELFCIAFWWNPFAWLMKNEVKLNLEYLADENVIHSKIDYEEYQHTLLQISIANTGMAFINNFNVSHLKKRIMMMNKKRSPILGTIKYLVILPLAVVLVCTNIEKANSMEHIKPNDEDALSIQPLPQDSMPIYEMVDQLPAFPGGDAEMMKFVAENLRYPESAQKARIQGRVVVRFVVTAEGKVTGAKIIRSLDPACDEETLRVIYAMPKWNPGIHKGENVAVYFTMPILFRLTKDSSNNTPPKIDFNKALIVLDGQIVENLNNVNENNIQNMSIFKDLSTAPEDYSKLAKEKGKESVIIIHSKQK